ncbi:hypothetical protein CUJ86_07900 [Methanofollis fontis]|uniref:Uncharacterized protein n=1 Tax=Methanofollis fontis TaxID=2052832 RepID=A0A483CTE8_9EURY|nr:hypothetical protein CUJ86_07900 [Methanofollis fontis]
MKRRTLLAPGPFHDFPRSTNNLFRASEPLSATVIALSKKSRKPILIKSHSSPGSRSPQNII